MFFYGASGHAKVVIESWRASGGDVSAIFDDDESVKTLLGLPVAGPFDEKKVKHGDVVISIGYNTVRRKIVERIKARYGKVIHPNTSISPSAVIGEGSVVMANVAVNASSVVGKHCILNTSSSVDHDCVIDDFVHIAPGSVLCGNVSVGVGAFVGAGAVVLPGIKIGAWAIVGAGSVVTRDVEANTTVAGNPAKSISFK